MAFSMAALTELQLVELTVGMTVGKKAGWTAVQRAPLKDHRLADPKAGTRAVKWAALKVEQRADMLDTWMVEWWADWKGRRKAG
jgi:hypothetical protein